MGNDVAVLVLVFFDGILEMEGEPKEALKYLAEKRECEYKYNMSKFECFEYDEDARHYNDYVEFGVELNEGDLEEMV